MAPTRPSSEALPIRITAVFPNFFGTSAATPHVAADCCLGIASAWRIRLDHTRPDARCPAAQHIPSFPDSLLRLRQSRSRWRTVLIQASADYSDVSQLNPNQFSLQMTGPGSISSLSINLTGADPTGGNIHKGYPGEVFTGPTTTQTGVGYPFTVSAASEAISSFDVKATYSKQAPAPSVPGGDYYQLNLGFASGKMDAKATLRFGIGHFEHHSSYSPSSTGTGGGDSSGGGAADLLRSRNSVTGGKFVGPGATFTGVFNDGTPFIGTFSNQIGLGWSPFRRLRIHQCPRGG